MRATIGEAIGLNGNSDEIDLLRRKIDGLNRKMVSLINESVESGEGIESHEAEFKELSDTIVHQMIECVKVYPDGRLDIIFGGGYLIEEALNEENK